MHLARKQKRSNGVMMCVRTSIGARHESVPPGIITVNCLSFSSPDPAVTVMKMSQIVDVCPSVRIIMRSSPITTQLIIPRLHTTPTLSRQQTLLDMTCLGVGGWWVYLRFACGTWNFQPVDYEYEVSLFLLHSFCPPSEDHGGDSRA
jgi:hypothetical protein